MTVEEFSEVIAFGNALPGPLGTQISGYIGYEVGGVFGTIVAVFGMVAPSLFLMITMLGILNKFKHSPKVKKMTALIRPTIAVLLGVLTYRFAETSYEGAGLWHTSFLLIASLILLEKFRLHPVFVIVGGLGYGALFLGN